MERNKKKYAENYEKNYQDKKDLLNGPLTGFSMAPFSLLKDKELSSAEKRLLIFLFTVSQSDKRNEQKIINTNINNLVKRTGMDRRVIYRTINSLQVKKYINRIKKSDEKSSKIKIQLLKELQDDSRWLKIYNRLWQYPALNYTDVIVYSYYLTIKNLLQFQKGIPINNIKAGNNLGFANNTISITNKRLIDLGVISIKNNKIFLLVDFSMPTEEEKIWQEEIKELKMSLENNKEDDFMNNFDYKDDLCDSDNHFAFESKTFDFDTFNF